jgi:hypothetical protein
LLFRNKKDTKKGGMKEGKKEVKEMMEGLMMISKE